MRPSVSIVIPTHDRGELLRSAVASAIAVEPLEVIVVDDRSADGSTGGIEQLGAKVISGSYGSAAATRNAGAAAAAGDVLAFLDSDDLALPGKTELAELLRDDVVLVHGATEVIGEHGEPRADLTAEHRASFARGRRVGTDYPGLAYHCAMYTSATAIRRDVFEAVGGYDETLGAYEDWDLYLRLSLHGRLVYAENVAARYRVWSGNVPWRSTAAWTARVAEKHLEDLPPLSPEAERRARFGFERRRAECYHILVEEREARRAALAALRAAPGRAMRDGVVRRPFLGSLVPSGVLRARRPPG